MTTDKQKAAMLEIKALIEFYESRGWCWLYVVGYLCSRHSGD